MNLIKNSVLLVDDEPQVLVALEDLLSDEFTVFKAQSPHAALDLVEHEPGIAVVLTDQRMPGMTGDELLTRVHEASNATRMLVTGFADLGAVIRAVNEGRIFAYVTKPWNPDELQIMVRKAAEHYRLAQELVQERTLLHDLMDNVPDGIYFKDRQLRFLRTNRAFARSLSGSSTESLVGKRLVDVLGLSTDATSAEAEDRRVMSEGLPAQDVLHEFQQNGSTRWISETKAPIRTPAGETIGLVGIARDVTERVQTEAALRRAEEQLLQSQKMEAIGQLAGGVAHDFNNVLSVILGYGEILLEELPKDDPKHGDISVMVGAAQRAAALTRQLLAFSRRRVVQPDIVDVNTIVWGVDKMLRRIIGEDIDLRTTLASSPATVRADPSQLEQIILNLTVNARDAMPKGGTIQIETATVELDERYAAGHVGVIPGTYVLLRATDNGTGMDAATQKRVFEPFFTTKEVGRGTGLGLSTVYGIVQQCRGHIVLVSELGKGTTFSIYLPQAEEPAVEPQIRRPQTRPPAGSGTLLVVEDDDEVRQVTVRMLRDQGYKVIDTGNAESARSLALEHRAGIDVLLVDIVMPKVSGAVLAEELTEIVPGLRVLYMSGYAGALVDREITLSSSSDYIEKPFVPSTLAKKIAELLNG
ncbi:MAG TPA: response regulator [Polyangiaceae bacterium]|nr:response regulator [Polyangiaceae bacterium]